MKTIKNILLVYPKAPQNTYWSFHYALNLIGKKSYMPPLGLITVAALIPESYHVRLIDQNIEPLEDADIAWADMVFLSAMLIQSTGFGQVVARCRRAGVPVAAGGPYPTSSHRQIDGVSHFVLGEAENTLGLFLDDLEKGCARKIYPAADRPKMDKRLTPRFDLLNLRAYASMCIQYSRGCPFTCEFCDIWQKYGNKPRTKSARHVEMELDALLALGWRGAVLVVDDNFIGNKHRLKHELLPMLVAWQRRHGHIFHFYTEASIDVAKDMELLTSMRDAGFSKIFIGIETPSADALKESGKAQNLKTDVTAAVSKIQENGMEVMGGFILGFDSDTPDIFSCQLDFIQRNAIPKAMVGLLIALPGTRLYDRMKSEGRLLHETHGNNTCHPVTNFRTRMPPEELRRGYQTLLSRLYDMNLRSYFMRCNLMLDRLQYTDHFQRSIGYDEIRILIRSLLRQPLTPYGFYYLQFVLRNLVKHPHIFPEVIRLAIQGHHFHVMTRQMRKVENVTQELSTGCLDIVTKMERCIETLSDHPEAGRHHLVDVWRQNDIFLKKIRKKIDAIHLDFRDDVSIRFDEKSRQLKLLFAPFEDELSRTGFRC